MNLKPEEIALSDDDLCDTIGFDTLVRLGRINYVEQVRRRQAKMREILDVIEEQGYAKPRH